MFSIGKAKQESHPDQQILQKLETDLRKEFSGDEMMFELHFIRVLMAIREGWVTVEEALEEPIGYRDNIRDLS